MRRDQDLFQLEGTWNPKSWSQKSPVRWGLRSGKASGRPSKSCSNFDFYLKKKMRGESLEQYQAGCTSEEPREPSLVVLTTARSLVEPIALGFLSFSSFDTI